MARAGGEYPLPVVFEPAHLLYRSHRPLCARAEYALFPEAGKQAFPRRKKLTMCLIDTFIPSITTATRFWRRT